MAAHSAEQPIGSIAPHSGERPSRAGVSERYGGGDEPPFAGGSPRGFRRRNTPGMPQRDRCVGGLNPMDRQPNGPRLCISRRILCMGRTICVLGGRRVPLLGLYAFEPAEGSAVSATGFHQKPAQVNIAAQRTEQTGQGEG